MICCRKDRGSDSLRDVVQRRVVQIKTVTSELGKTFLSLVELGIGHQGDFLPDTVDWQAIQALANRQGLAAVILDGIERLPEYERPPKDLLLEWIGVVFQNYENRYKLYRRAIGELAGFYNAHGFKIMVLKGYACSLDWPKPEHRPCGDIDIWQFGRQKEADEELGSWLKNHGSQSEINCRHHHHTVFEWDGFAVENHYDFVNVFAHKSSRKLEKIFKELGQDDGHSVVVNDEKVYLPSPNLHALFLIRHMLSHFAATEINLRQVLDWAFFVEKHTNEVDWDWLDCVLKDYHMKDFFNCINAICVDNLGFSASIFPLVQFLPGLKERMLNDILDPKFPTDEPKGLFVRMAYKLRRWQGNAWKQKMCYGESRWSAFCSGIWAKILKPASI